MCPQSSVWRQLVFLFKVLFVANPPLHLDTVLGMETSPLT